MEGKENSLGSSVPAPTPASSASWYCCRAKVSVSAGTGARDTPAPSRGVPVCPSPVAPPPPARARRYLQHFAVHHGADGAGAEARDEAFEESRSSIDLHDVLGYGTGGQNPPRHRDPPR